MFNKVILTIMKNYLFNILLTAIATFLIAVLSFLFGAENAVSTAMASGALSGVAISVSYMFGKLMKGTAWSKEMGIRLIVMLITGIVFGIFGGWTMTLY